MVTIVPVVVVEIAVGAVHANTNVSAGAAPAATATPTDTAAAAAAAAATAAATATVTTGVLPDRTVLAVRAEPSLSHPGRRVVVATVDVVTIAVVVTRATYTDTNPHNDTDAAAIVAYSIGVGQQVPPAHAAHL